MLDVPERNFYEVLRFFKKKIDDRKKNSRLIEFSKNLKISNFQKKNYLKELVQAIRLCFILILKMKHIPKARSRNRMMDLSSSLES